MRRLVPGLLAGLLALAPAAAHAQGSIFGTRGPGVPGRQLSARALATGGAFGLFDPESGLNPAALGYVPALTASFTSTSEFRSVATPAGDASLRSTRFPQVGVAIPFRRLPFIASVGFSNYANRDFGLVREDTLLLRGAPVAVTDTVRSEGGLTDLRFALAARGVGPATLGAGVHLITGRDRIDVRRVFGDTAYQSIRQRSELSTAAVGVSAGTVITLTPSLFAAALVRTDGTGDVEADSIATGRSVDFPWSLGGGLRFRPTPRLDVAVSALYRTWRDASAGLLAEGTFGSDNTLELSGGFEYVKDVRRPGHLPLRAGVHYATLPFLLADGTQPREFGVAAGTGIRFAQQRAGLELTLQRIWRSAGGDRTERGWLVSVGGSVRP